MARRASQPSPAGRELEIPESWDGALLALLAAANFLIVLWTFRAALTILPNTGDEFSGLFQAKIFASGRLTAPAPAPAEPFLAEYIGVRGGRWFSIYPPAHALLLAVGLLLGDATLIPALLSSAALVAAFLVARRAGGRGAAWLTAGLLFVAPSFRLYSASYYSHVTSLFAAVVCVLLALKVREEPAELRRGAAAFAAAAVLGLAARPFELFWVLVPIAVWLVVERPALRRGEPARLIPAAAVVFAGLAAAAAYNGLISGGLWRSVYLGTVNVGGKLAVERNLSLSALARLARMFADAAKWLFALGRFPTGSLKDVSPADLNISWPLLALALALGARDARGAKPDARARRLLLGVAACVVIGHLFYDKEHGRFGERRFYEAGFVFCFFAARLLLNETGRLPRIFRAPALALLLLVPAAAYLPGTMLAIRDGTETRMDPYLKVQRAGVHDALILLRGFPELPPAFYARNDPDLRGNVYAVERATAVASGLLPDRPRYVYSFDGLRKDFTLVRVPAPVDP